MQYKFLLKLLFLAALIIIIILPLYFFLPSLVDEWARHIESSKETIVLLESNKKKWVKAIEEKMNMGEEINEEETVEVKSILLDVPFVCQAPDAEWDNDVFQEGCEEVSTLMAVAWARGENLTKEYAKEQLMLMSEYQAKEYGEYRDTSAQDTLNHLIKGYFAYDKAEIKKDITLNDLIAEVLKGRVLIVPLDGQALGNPYFTPPGPERHMLVIIGYNTNNREFITNEGGTRRGEKYRYDEDVLFNSIRDYPTGFHQPIDKVEKTMISVWK